jgi:hypothetical protein
MDLNFFVKNLRHIEKLNKTNPKYCEYNNNFVEYIKKEESISDIFNNLIHKSSCIPFIFDNFLTNVEITELLSNINFHILNNKYSIESIINYLTNIVCLKNIRYCFLQIMKDKCLFSDTIFKKIFVSNFSKLTKFTSQNSIIIDSLFLKIFSTKKGTNMFLSCIKCNTEYGYTQSNEILFEKDIFYKDLTLILIEVFSKKYGYYVKTIHTNKEGFELFTFINNLIKTNYTSLINELRFLKETFSNSDARYYRKRREKNIIKILNNYDYYVLIDNFYTTCNLWLINITEKLEKNNDVIELNRETIDNILYGIYYHNIYNFVLNTPNKYMFVMISKIIKKELTKNYNLIIDYIYLLKDFITCKKHNKYKHFDFYLGKIVIEIFDIYSFIYDYIKDNQYDIFNFTIRICNICEQTIFTKNNFRNILKKKLLKNKTKTNLKKFTLNLIETSNNCLDYLDTYIFSNNDNERYFRFGNIYYDYLLILLGTIKNLCNYYPDIIFSDELKDLFRNFIQNILSKNKNVIINNLIVEYDTIYIYEIIKDIILLTKDYKNIIRDIDLKNLKEKLIYNCKLTVSDIMYLNKIIIQNTIDSITKKDIVHPSHFCDPITDGLIENPIMLPNNIIVDKSMIYRYLLNNKSNPFDRQYLTKQILDGFNKQPEILDKINIFITELNNYKKDNL